MIVQLVFAAAFGACAGSLINVLAYRMPLGISVVTPPSRCPSCHTKLTWRENIPIFGWLLLKGRCRFCKSRISAEYPIVEAIVAGLFVLTYFFFYCLPLPWIWPPATKAIWLGIDWSLVRPEWAHAGFAATWPLFVMMVVMIGCLVAMTICDAKTYMIPIQLAWSAAIAGVAAHLGLGVFAQWWGARPRGFSAVPRHLFDTAPDWSWAIASPGPKGWGLVGLAIGGVVGLLVANVLLAKGLIRRSFADYDDWERSVTKTERVAVPPPDPEVSPAAAFYAKVWKPSEETTPAPGTPAAESAEASKASNEVGGVAEAGVVGGAESPADMWLMYPHARREMIKELIYLSPAVTLGMLGAWLAVKLAGPWAPGITPAMMGTPAVAVPMWLDALSGSLLGLLVGGGVVWMVRILGSLAFGKEAMGLGDVHLMAGVGACLGWIDATLAFFLSAFVGLAWTLGATLVQGRSARSLPLGPSLAFATLLVVFLKPVIEWGMGRIAPAWAPFNIP